MDSSYVSRMDNQTTPAPAIVAAVLNETLPPHLTLFDLAVEPPALWEEHRSRIEGMMTDRAAFGQVRTSPLLTIVPICRLDEPHGFHAQPVKTVLRRDLRCYFPHGRLNFGIIFIRIRDFIGLIAQ
jgi:hypothetical protein